MTRAPDSQAETQSAHLVSDTNVFFDKPGVAKLMGAPTDLAVDRNLLGVIDGGDGVTSNASVLEIDAEGELTLSFAVRWGAAGERSAGEGSEWKLRSALRGFRCFRSGR
jgi:hypothetical protein